LHRHTASIDAPYLSDHTLPLPSLGGQRDVIREPAEVAGEVMRIQPRVQMRRVCAFLIGLTGSASLISAISGENAEFFAGGLVSKLQRNAAQLSRNGVT
jgi:hypothetical protein